MRENVSSGAHASPGCDCDSSGETLGHTAMGVSPEVERAPAEAFKEAGGHLDLLPLRE